MQVLGTPTKEELIAMNPNFKDKDYPKHKVGSGITKLFVNDDPPLHMVELTAAILKFDPKQRITAIESLAHPYFHQLQKPDLEVFLRISITNRL